MGQIKDLISYTQGGVLSKVVVKNDKLNITLFCMGANTDIGTHTSTKQGIIYVVEGKGVFTHGQEKIEMIPDVMIHMDENTKHSINVVENTSFLLILMS